MFLQKANADYRGWLLLGFFIASTTVFAAEPANNANPDPKSPAVPLQQGLAELAKGNVLAADRWFQITSNDFPDRLDGLRAMSLQITDRLAKELSHVKVGHYLLDGTKMVLRNKEPWLTAIREQEKAALQWGDDLHEKAALFIQRDQNQWPLQMEIKVDTKPLAQQQGAADSTEKLRGRLAKGELLEGEELGKLEQAVWLSSYIGFLAETMQLPDSELLEGNYSGIINRPAFYRAVGVRLFILWERSKDRKFAELARTYFERVLSLTTETPYQADRQKASDFLAKLASVTPANPAANANGNGKKEKKHDVRK